MRKFTLIATLLLVALACALPGTAAPAGVAPADAPFDPAILNTAVVETAGAAQTQTALALPTATRTATSTRIPTPTQTYTPTFIFSLATFTPLPTYTMPGSISEGALAITGTPGPDDGFKMSDEEWHCIVAATLPPRNTEFDQGAHFDVYWTLFNNGTKAWPFYGVDLVYTGGFRHEGKKIQDFTRTVSPGQRVTVGASFIAPKLAGQYQTFFKLMVGKRLFCGIKYTFVVREGK